MKRLDIRDKRRKGKRLLCEGSKRCRWSVSTKSGRSVQVKTERALTLSALDLGSSALLVVVVHLVLSVNVSGLLALRGLLEGDLVNVDVVGELLGRRSRGEGLLEVRDELDRDRVREGNVDLDVEVSELVVSVRGHTLSRDALERA